MHYMEAIEELGERLNYRVHNRQKNLTDEKETTLKTTISQLQSYRVDDFTFKLSVQEDLTMAKDVHNAILMREEYIE
jgi:hypothetical protein